MAITTTQKLPPYDKEKAMQECLDKEKKVNYWPFKIPYKIKDRND
jgi:hypothetical protein